MFPYFSPNVLLESKCGIYNQNRIHWKKKQTKYTIVQCIDRAGRGETGKGEKGWFFRNEKKSTKEKSRRKIADEKEYGGNRKKTRSNSPGTQKRKEERKKQDFAAKQKKNRKKSIHLFYLMLRGEGEGEKERGREKVVKKIWIDRQRKEKAEARAVMPPMTNKQKKNKQKENKRGNMVVSVGGGMKSSLFLFRWLSLWSLGSERSRNPFIFKATSFFSRTTLTQSFCFGGQKEVRKGGNRCWAVLAWTVGFSVSLCLPFFADVSFIEDVPLFDH